MELTSWMMVFVRVGAMLSVFPVFSDPNFPKRVRLALAALIAWLVVPTLPSMNIDVSNLWSLVRVIGLETMIGLLLGFSSKMIFYALDMAGGIVANEIGLQLPASVNPMSGGQVTAPGMLLNYLAAVIWLSLDLHHWLLLGFQRTYFFLPVGGAHLSEALLIDLLARFRGVFVVALQMAAPVMAVSFIISLVFSVLGRAVPQMNVFSESFAVRILAGLAVFGLTIQLMAQHIVNYLNRLPEDFLRVAQLLGSA
ncbi:MAG: flagellar biosynthetic protein FliR [Opitutaceae bacterium]|nr:flagellar biosynthetic protein FliR [Verrucomicrobiales bacterium]